MLYNELLDHLDSVLVEYYPSASNHSLPVEDIVERIESAINIEHFNILTKRILIGTFEARKKLIKYYTDTDNTSVYSIATAMDPTVKFGLWNIDGGWGDFGTHCEFLVKQEWLRNFKNDGSHGSNITQVQVEANVVPQQSKRLFGSMMRKIAQTSFANALSIDELDQYVQEGPVQEPLSIIAADTKGKAKETVSDYMTDAEVQRFLTDIREKTNENEETEEKIEEDLLPSNDSHTKLDNLDSNILQIWKTYSLPKIEGGKYPALSAMAKKYLSIPATSTPCERLFSRAKRITTIARAKLGVIFDV